VDNYRVIGVFLETTNDNLIYEIEEILTKNNINAIAVIDSHNSSSLQSALGYLMDQLLGLLKHKERQEK
jgi:hypothetical protein